MADYLYLAYLEASEVAVEEEAAAAVDGQVAAVAEAVEAVEEIY